VELDVGADRILEAADCTVVLLQRRSQLIDLVLCRVRRRVPDETDLEEKAHALQLPLAFAVREKLLNRRNNAGNDALGVWLGDACRRAIADLDQP
jgi:hypothetical protein